MNAKIRQLKKEQDEWLVRLYNDAVKHKKRYKNLFEGISLQEVYDDCIWEEVRGSYWTKLGESYACMDIINATSIKELDRIARNIDTDFHPIVKINLLLNIEIKKEELRKK